MKCLQDTNVKLAYEFFPGCQVKELHAAAHKYHPAATQSGCSNPIAATSHLETSREVGNKGLQGLEPFQHQTAMGRSSCPFVFSYWDKSRQERLLQEGQSCFHCPGTAVTVCSDIILAQLFVDP